MNQTRPLTRLAQRLGLMIRDCREGGRFRSSSDRANATARRMSTGSQIAVPSVETDVPDYSVAVAVFRPGRVMPHPRCPSYTIQQPRPLGEGYLAEANLQVVLVKQNLPNPSVVSLTCSAHTVVHVGFIDGSDVNAAIVSSPWRRFAVPADSSVRRDQEQEVGTSGCGVSPRSCERSSLQPTHDRPPIWKRSTLFEPRGPRDTRENPTSECAIPFFFHRDD